VEPERREPARPRELNLFLLLSALGMAFAVVIAVWMYFIAPGLLG
jgi:hypothetical protein